MQDELVDYVDENDKVIGQALRGEIKTQRLGAMRVSSVLLFTSKQEVILGKMARRKGDGANLLTFTSSGHAMAGETSQEAAVRELYEEQGVKLNSNGLILKAKIVSYHDGDLTKPKRIRSIYTGICDEILTPNKEEYQYNLLFMEENLKQFIKKAPRIFYPAFIEGFKKMNFMRKKNIFSNSLSGVSDDSTNTPLVLQPVLFRGKE